MVNPYIVPGARVRLREPGLYAAVHTYVIADVKGETVRLRNGYAWCTSSWFKPIVRVKMGRRVDTACYPSWSAWIEP
jgi:hypothetical protein